MPLVWTEGEYAGRGALWSTSRASNFPWMTEYGGSGNLADLRPGLERAIAAFRHNERVAYEAASVPYPWN